MIRILGSSEAKAHQEVPSCTSLHGPPQRSTPDGGFNDRHCPSRCWRPEVRGPGVADLGSPKAALLGWQVATFSLCPHTTFPLCEHIPGVPSLLTVTPALLNQGPTHLTPFHLKYHLQGPLEYGPTEEGAGLRSDNRETRAVCPQHQHWAAKFPRQQETNVLGIRGTSEEREW